jgi:hypothetical protein
MRILSTEAERDRGDSNEKKVAGGQGSMWASAVCRIIVGMVTRYRRLSLCNL